MDPRCFPPWVGPDSSPEWEISLVMSLTLPPVLPLWSRPDPVGTPGEGSRSEGRMFGP